MMKELLKPIAVPVMIFLLFAAGCREPENQGTNPAVPQNPNELTEADVLEAFGLTKGSITASAAAKKIANDMPAASGVIFTERNFIAYDDEAGTFTVKVKGTKNGKNFSQKISVTGFTHPLAGKTIQSLADCELNLDEGIEHNYSLEKYIAEVNKDSSGAKLVKKLSFMLSDGSTIEIGEHDAYTLAAKAEKKTVSGTDKVKVNQVFEIVYRKKTENSTGETTAKKKDTTIYNSPNLIKDYFTKKDVFNYILGKVKDDESFIKADSGSFASSVYAVAMVTQVAGDIFDESKISKYINLYDTKGDGHLEIKNITAGVYNIRNGGIKVDDYEGALTVDYYIATKDSAAQATPPANKISERNTVKRSGFKKIVPETVKKEFAFTVGKIGGGNGTKQKWLDRSVGAVLIQKNEHPQDNYDNWFIIDDVLTDTDISGYYLILNGEAYSSCKPVSGQQFRLKTNSASEPDILVERLSLKKKKGEENLIISMQFMGKTNTVDISVKPVSY